MIEKNILKNCKDVLESVTEAPALSCVESYFIPWIKEKYPVEKLYSETIVSFCGAEKLLSNNNFESIALPRIQDLAEQAGVVNHEKRKFHGENPTDSEMILLRVNPCYFTGKQVAWREDHFVRLIARSKKYTYVVNEYPAEIRKMSIDEAQWLQGECLIYHVNDSVPLEHSKAQLPMGCAERKGVEIMEQLRDVLMVYRISLKRLLACYPQDAEIKKLLEKADAMFFKSAIAAKKGFKDRVLTSLWRDEMLKAEQDYFVRRKICSKK